MGRGGWPAPSGGQQGVVQAAVPLRQRGGRHAHPLRRPDHGGVARVSFHLILLFSSGGEDNSDYDMSSHPILIDPSTINYIFTYNFKYIDDV